MLPTPSRQSPRRRRPAARRPGLNGPGRGPPKTVTAVEVLRQFRELFRLSQRHAQRVGTRCGLSGAQLWAMAELESQPGLKISDLASALSVHLSTASNLLDRLQAKSLIRRERRQVGDQRVVRVRLTRAGQKVLRTAPRPAAGVIPDALDRMPERALATLSRELAVLLDLARVRARDAAMEPLAEP